LTVGTGSKCSHQNPIRKKRPANITTSIYMAQTATIAVRRILMRPKALKIAVSMISPKIGTDKKESLYFYRPSWLIG
jgi:hypothetical protein